MTITVHDDGDLVVVTVDSLRFAITVETAADFAWVLVAAATRIRKRQLA